MGMSKLAAARRKQQRTPVCERAAVMAAGPLCSDTQQQIGAEPLLQEALPLADVRRIAGADARRREEGLCPRRSSRRWRNSASAAAESSCETISQRWLLCWWRHHPAFISRPPRRHPFRPPLRPKPLAPATGAPPRGSARPLSGREARSLAAPAVAGAAILTLANGASGSYCRLEFGPGPPLSG